MTGIEVDRLAVDLVGLAAADVAIWRCRARPTLARRLRELDPTLDGFAADRQAAELVDRIVARARELDREDRAAPATATKRPRPNRRA